MNTGGRPEEDLIGSPTQLKELLESQDQPLRPALLLRHFNRGQSMGANFPRPLFSVLAGASIAMPLPESIPVVTERAVQDEKYPKELPHTSHVEVVSLDGCPDGGLRAWLVVLGVYLSFVIIGWCFFSHLSAVQVFCGLCATVGLVNAWGVSTTASLGNSGTPRLIATHRRSKHTIKRSSCRIDRHLMCELREACSRTS